MRQSLAEQSRAEQSRAEQPNGCSFGVCESWGTSWEFNRKYNENISLFG